MPTTLSPTDIANLALSRCGAQSISSLIDQRSTSAIICNANFQLCYLEISRATRWNCLMTPAVLVEIPQTPIPGSTPTVISTAWAPLTSYSASAYVTYGEALYQVQYNYTSTAIFANDLTTGALVQVDVAIAGCGCSSFGASTFGSLYPSGWAHQYALPSDFVLLSTLNDNNCWNGVGEGDEYEIMGSSLYTDAEQAVIKYVQNVADTTRFDSLLTSALVALLAARICTPLRLDSGNMSAQFMSEYALLLSHARTKDAGEAMVRRFNPINSSTFIQSRWGGFNG